jgi:hypothetical protein
VVYSETNPSSPSRPDQFQKISWLPGFWWKSDTSSDEITGHIAVYQLALDLLCETAEEKTIARDLLVNMVRYIVQNDFQLIDWTGKPTTWGHWNPEYLNKKFASWYDIRGLNSLQILSWIVAADRVTDVIDDHELFGRAFVNLTENYLYHMNLVNAKIVEPNDVNFSDDELTFLAYFTFDYSRNSTQLASMLYPYVDSSIRRTWATVKSYKNPFYAACTQFHDASLTSDLYFESLRNWPMDGVGWPVDNSGRFDLRFVDKFDEENDWDTVTLMSNDEILCQRYNCDPYRTGAQGNGLSESDAGGPILAYWMIKWLEMQK